MERSDGEASGRDTWEADGLLEGLEDDDAREARRKLLDELSADGFPLEELRTAVQEERLVLLPVERALMGPVRHSMHALAAASGFDAEQLAKWQRVAGVTAPEDPEAPAFTDEDLAAVERARGYVDAGLPLEEIRPVLRTMSTAMGRAAEASRQVFAGAYLRPGDNEYDLAKRYAAMADVLVPMVIQDLEYLLRVHLREFTRHDALGLAERATGELPRAVEVAVGFADFVGFTELGEEVIVDVADRLLELADEHVHKPARVVKAIGDAVMIVSRDPRVLLDSLLDLVDAAEADSELPALRAGLAWGQAVPRAGDWYGGTVNLASRLCQRARAGSVLTTNAARDVIEGERSGGEAPGRDRSYAWSEAGFKNLKGIPDPVPTLRVRRQI